MSKFSKQSLNLTLFPKGSKVEITSDEEGFKGAWYPAKILKNPSQKSPFFFVEYDTLLAEDETKPLREFVNSDFIRPSPPPFLDHEGFQLNDVVDAFYSDGWWTGVITTVVETGRLFLVSFENPPDQIQVGVADLRVHREWVHGNWLPPKMQRTTGLMFSSGKKVEVSFSKEEYRDVWFPAVVLEDKGDGSFFVEYESPGICDEAGLLKVVVDSLHIRPCPPYLKDRNFDLLEKVDAFFDFGWWSGVITKELADSWYVVYFKYTRNNRKCNRSELRPHMEWRDGKWFSSPKDVFIPSDYQGLAGDTVKNDEADVSLGTSSAKKARTEEGIPIEKLTNGNEQAMDSMKKKKKHTTDDTLSLPAKKLKRRNVMEPPQNLADPPSKNAISDFTTPPTGKTGSSSSEQPMVVDQSSAKTDTISPGKNDKVELNTTIPVKKRGRPPKLKIRKSKGEVEGEGEGEVEVEGEGEGKEGNAAGNDAPDSVDKESVTKEIDTPEITGLVNNGKKDPQPEPTDELPVEELLALAKSEKQQVDDPAKLDISATKMEGNQPAGVGESTPLTPKRRGRPPKLQKIVFKASGPVKQQNGDAVTNEMVVKDFIIDAVGSPRTAGMEMISPLTEKRETPRGAQTSNKQQKKYSLKRGRRTISLNKETLIQDLNDVPTGKETEDFEKDSSIKEASAENTDKLPRNTSDDQPLSKWIESTHSPPVLNGSVIPVEAAQVETVGSQGLPFLKNASVWNTIDSMEVFKTMPQNPHFRPLASCKASSREGLAIGSMINFSGVVENTLKLQLDVPKSVIEENLETLVELESYGFNVEVIRERLTKLLSIKDNHEKLDGQSKEIKTRIIEHDREKEKIDEEIEDIDKQIHALEEKRAFAVLMRQKKGSEIGSLESKVRGLDDGLKSVRAEFEGLASAPW